MADDRITSHGKQVLMDGAHMADARDDATAEIIALAVTWSGVAADDLPDDVDAKLRAFLA